MQKRRSPSRKSNLQQLQNIIRGSHNPLVAVSATRNSLSISDLRALARWLHYVRRGNRGVFHGQNPRRIAHLGLQPILAPIPIEREIIWASEFLKYHANQIKTFIPMAQTFEKHLLEGKYGDCGILLDNIADRLGLSLWEIENRIALLQLEEGLEKQKRYAADLRIGRDQDDFISFIIFSISHRNEDSATSGRFTSNLSDRLDKWEVDSDLQAYLLFRLANQPPKDDLALASILRYEAVFPIIDYYETFVRLAQITFSENNETTYHGIFLQELSDLATVINDCRIEKILFSVGLSTSLSENNLKCDLSAQDALAKGEAATAIELAAHAQEQQPLNICSWITEAQAKAELIASQQDMPTHLSARIASFALAIAGRRDNLRDAEIGLEKMCLNFRHMGFSSAL